MAEFAPRRHMKVTFSRRLIADLLDVPDDVRIERLIPTFDPGGFDVVLSSDRFDEVPEDAEAPRVVGLWRDSVEHEGKTFVRFRADV